MTLIEAAYETGVLEPLAPADLKEHQRHRLIVQEAAMPALANTQEVSLEFKAKLERPHEGPVR